MADSFTANWKGKVKYLWELLVTGEARLPLGIGFPAIQVPSSDPNVLDDYEEGSWTPTFTALGTAPTGVTYTTRLGTYTKIGNSVQARFHVVLSSKGAGGVGSIAVTGLPVAAAAGIDNFAGLRASNVTFTAGMTYLTAGVGTGDNKVGILEHGSAVAAQNVTWANCANTSSFIGQIEFAVAT